MKTGLVSVGMLAFHGEPFLSRALDALLRQDYAPIEIIILDDIRSSEQTKAVAQEYARRHPDRIRYVLDTVPRTTHEASNHVVTFAQGEFFTYAGDDDIWDSSYVRRLVDALREHPGIAMVYTNGYYLDGNDRRYDGTVVKPHRLYTRNHTVSYMIRTFLMHRHVVPIIFGLFRTAVLRAMLPFHTFDGLQDVDNLFIVKLFAHARIDSVPEPLFGRRVDHRPVGATPIHAELGSGVPEGWWQYCRHQWRLHREVTAVLRCSPLPRGQRWFLQSWSLWAWLWFVSVSYPLFVGGMVRRTPFRQLRRWIST